MRFREVEKNIEREVMNKKVEEAACMKIKPKTNITFEEAKDFWSQVFNGVKEGN